MASVTVQVTITGLIVPGNRGSTGFPISISLVAGLPFTCSKISVILILSRGISFDSVALALAIVVLLAEVDIVVALDVGFGVDTVGSLYFSVVTFI